MRADRPYSAATVAASSASHSGVLIIDGVFARSRARATAPATVPARSTRAARLAGPASSSRISAGSPESPRSPPGEAADFIVNW